MHEGMSSTCVTWSLVRKIILASSDQSCYSVTGQRCKGKAHADTKQRRNRSAALDGRGDAAFRKGVSRAGRGQGDIPAARRFVCAVARRGWRLRLQVDGGWYGRPARRRAALELRRDSLGEPRRHARQGQTAESRRRTVGRPRAVV